MAKLYKYHTGQLLFECPGCKRTHAITPRQAGKPVEHPSWEWNGSMDSPTFSPSVLVQGESTCHSFITDGRIRFLNNCSHELAGQTVELPEINPDEYE